MKPYIGSLTSLDLDVETWIPDTDDFAVALSLVVGPAGEPAGELFYITVCSPSWLAKVVQEDEVFDARHHLVVTSFSWPRIRSYIEQQVNAVEGETWDEVGEKLGRLGDWEYEDYRPGLQSW